MDLKDYSGDYIPNLKYTDFDKQLVKNLYATTNDLYVMIDGYWVGLMREKLGLEETTKISNQVWAYMLTQEAKRIAKVFNIRTGPEANIIDFIKLFQVTPGYNLDKYPQKAEIYNEYRATVQFQSCASLLYYERHGLVQADRVPGCCAVEIDAMSAVAHVVNPNIKVKPLKRPPRSGPEGMFCLWEFTLDTVAQPDQKESNAAVAA